MSEPLCQAKAVSLSQTQHLDKGSKVQSGFGASQLDRACAGKARKGGQEGTISNTARRQESKGTQQKLLPPEKGLQQPQPSCLRLHLFRAQPGLVAYKVLSRLEKESDDGSAWPAHSQGQKAHVQPTPIPAQPLWG